MNCGSFQYRSQRKRQQGYLLLTIMLMAALVMIALAVELPNIANQVRRDREQELIHRGAQYARAIKKYYKKTGSYPLSIEQLQETNHIRFLRKKYKDPMTGEEFRLLHQGEVQLTMKTPGTGGGASVSVTPTGGSLNPSSSPSRPGSSTSSSGFSGPKFGGGPFIGVASTSEKKSIHVFNDKDQYKDWAFIYDPTMDRGQGLINGPYNGTPAFGGGQIPGATAPGQTGTGTTSPTGSPAPTPR